MRSQDDPIRSWRRKLWLSATVASGLLALCTYWAIFLPAEVAVELPGFRPAPGATEQSVELPEPIDRSLFAAKLWNPPPPPPSLEQPAAAVAEAPKLLNLQLIGIIKEDGERKAALYDVDDDRILILQSGAKVHDHTIISITEKAVVLSNGASTSTLNLVEEPS